MNIDSGYEEELAKPRKDWQKLYNLRTADNEILEHEKAEMSKQLCIFKDFYYEGKLASDLYLLHRAIRYHDNICAGWLISDVFHKERAFKELLGHIPYTITMSISKYNYIRLQNGSEIRFFTDKEQMRGKIFNVLVTDYTIPDHEKVLYVREQKERKL
jgi:hypothetical protein